MTVVRIFKVDPEKTVEVPEALFSELLPVIDHLGELKITLYAIWYLGSQVKEPRFLRYMEMLKDERLMAGFGDSYGIQKMALSDALQRAVNRGTLLCVGNVGDEHDSIYFPNSAAGRAAFDGLAAGEWDPDQIESFPVKLQPERPNIYALYEQNIGPLTPILSETLQEAEKNYPLEWIEDAIRIAVVKNVRTWRYIEAILRSWKEKGRDGTDRETTEENRKRDSEGKFGDYVNR